MSLWKKLHSYVSEFEKTIDDGFANRNQQIMAPEENKTINDSDISDTDLIKLDDQKENENSSTEKSIQINDEKEETKNQEGDNIDNNENTDIDLNNEKQEEEENEAEIQQKISDLKQKIQNVEDELENQNKLFEKMQKIKETMGPNSDSLIYEYETRNSKLNSQLKELEDIEEKTKKEIEELNSNFNLLIHSNSTLEPKNQSSENIANYDSNQINIQLQKDYSNIQNKLSQAQDEYKKIIETSKNLINEDQQLTVDIDTTIDLIKKNKSKIDQLKKERESIEASISKIQNEIESEKETNINLSMENATSQNDLHKVKDEQDMYNEKVATIRKEISQNKEKIKMAENENQRANEKQRRDKIEAMKNLTTSLINEIEKERSKVLGEIQNISNTQKSEEEKEEAEKREMQNMINEAEIESKRLEKRFSDSKSSIPNFVTPIENQIETIKSVFAANETVEKTVASRLLSQLSEIEQKKESITFSNKKLSEEIEKANFEKESLNTKALDLKIHEIAEKADKLLKEIENLRNLKFDINDQINQLDADISIKKSKLLQISSNKRALESKYLAEIRQIKEKKGSSSFNGQKSFENDEPSESSSLFGIWKALAKECGEIDNEIEKKQEAISKQADLEKIFNETLEIVSEHQENVDIAKRTIQREKDFFKKRVQELVSDQ
ncbi:hypothetical protein M9Y10_033383 [Tritrichomonas musculus]|uniref:Viral A-type inclusion protein n=1 Tax=Tritrichomonas musculus TaxID=1915356 RepID=A0ABR2KD37_9EUKA